MLRCSCTSTRTSWLLAALLVAGPLEVAGQGPATVRVEENFRRAPNEVVLARLAPGTPLSVVGSEGDWLQVDLEGWVWLASLQLSDSDLDLAVAASEGENLRSAPQGTILGRLEDGALLEELGREPGWAHVRRRGWIWGASVTTSTASAQAEPAAAAALAGDATPTGSAPSQPAASQAPPVRRPEGFTSPGGGGASILTAPDGDTLAVTTARGDLQVVSREGNWARVRLEGWVWMPGAAQASADGAPAALSPEDLTREPEAHVGRVVSWTLQFISLESAEAIRTDFRRGEPFLLTRFGGSDGPFVYVAVPPERQTEVQGLVPLERISVTARVRTGASALTGTPIVELLSMERRP